jgi:hypothetical protein
MIGRGAPVPFENNGLFSVKSKGPEARAGLSYEAKDGTLDFQTPLLDDELDPDKSYYTHFWANVGHTGVVYRRSDNNTQLALKYRAMVSRCPGQTLTIDGVDYSFHEGMKVKQVAFLARYKDEMARYAEQLRPFFEGYTDAAYEAHVHHADPHQKRLERIRGYGEMCELGATAWKGWLDPAIRVIYKMKTMEIAKVGKPPRGIVNLQVVASLAGFKATEYLKKAQSAVPIICDMGGRVSKAEFIMSPTTEDIDRVFDDMYISQYDVYFVYFSDDSILRYVWNGRPYWANLDISKCDCSHGEGIFAAYRDLFPEYIRPDVDTLLAQLISPCTLTSSHKDFPGRKVIITPSEATLYSGATPTTTLNNVSCNTIFYAIRDCDVSECKNIEEVGRALEAAIASTGYIVTGLSADDTWCEIFEDLQFLKHSPVRDTNGDWHALKNLGVLGRAGGACKGDLPGRGDLENRAAVFQSNLLHGMYPRDSFPMLDMMKKTAHDAITSPLSAKGHKRMTAMLADIFRYKPTTRDDQPMHIYAMESIGRRYRLTTTEIDSLIDYSTYGFGYVTSSMAWHKILMKDYGLAVIPAEFLTEQ